MQEQNFEKQVQQKLEELSLTPSAPVWQKVENELREKKRKRRVLVFWLFPILMIGAGTYWGLQSVNNTKENRASLSSPADNQTVDNPTTFPDQKKVTISPVTTDQSATVDSGHTITQTTVKSTPKPFNQNDIDKTTSVIHKQHSTKSITGKQQSETGNISKSNQKSKTLQSLKSKTKRSSISEYDQPVVTTNNTEAESLQNESNIDRVIALQTMDPDQVNPISQLVTPSVMKSEGIVSATDALPSKKGEKNIPKWSWAVQAAYGVSSVQSEFLSTRSSTPAAYSRDLNNAGFPSQPGPQANTATAPKSEKGPAFRINFTVNRSINRRLAATASLQYSYLSTKNMVGQTVARDTIVTFDAENKMFLDQFYRPAQNGQLQEYVNQYHFVELPVGIEWQLHKRLPLRLQTGLSLSYLLHTNALVFDPNAGIYYQNKDLFSKLQVQYFNGLTYRVWQNKKYAVHIGPYLQYGITKLQKENNNQHLLSTGIKAQFSL